MPTSIMQENELAWIVDPNETPLFTLTNVNLQSSSLYSTSHWSYMWGSNGNQTLLLDRVSGTTYLSIFVSVILNLSSLEFRQLLKIFAETVLPYW